MASRPFLRKSQPRYTPKPRSLSKPYNLREVTWEEILDVNTLAYLLLETSNLKFPDGTVLFTIELLVDLPEEYLTKLVQAYGLINFQSTLDQFIDLLWFFYVTGAEPRYNSQDVATLSGLSEEQLQSYIPPDLKGLLPGHAGTLFYILTGITPYHRNPSEPRINALKITYGRHIIRAALYIKYERSVLEGLRLGEFRVNILSPYDIKYQDAYQPYPVLELFEPYITGYQRSFKELEASDNVDSLANSLGLVFPPHLRLSGEHTNYYWHNLLTYRTVLAYRQGLPISKQAKKKDLSIFPDKELLGVAKPNDWVDRNDLVRQVTRMINPFEKLFGTS